MEKQVDVAIIGAGSAGLYALSTVRKVTQNVVIINHGHHGTTCARVGCMPSKALIHCAQTFHQRHHFSQLGILGHESLTVDLPTVLKHVRKLRDNFVQRVLTNVHQLGDKRIDGFAEFVEPTLLKVDNTYIRAKKIIIATGSRPVILKKWEKFSDAVLTTDTLFEQENLPPTMAILGLGAIGVEIGQTLSRLGIEIVGVDLAESIAGLKDPEVNQVAIELINQEFPLWLGQPVDLNEQSDGKIIVSSGNRRVTVDKVLACLGRVPNTTGLGLEKLGIELDIRGVPKFNPNTMQIADLPIFITGDAVGERAVLHEAADEGRIAGFNATHDKLTFFQRKPRLNITFCDPNIVSVGASVNFNSQEVAVGQMNFTPQGRAVIMGKNRGILRIYAKKEGGQLLGAEMIVPDGEHLGHLLAWAIQCRLSVFDLLKMPFYHPVIEEGLQNALYHLSGQVNSAKQEDLVELHNLSSM